MKTCITYLAFPGNQFSKFLVLIFLFSSSLSFGQTYYSNFTNPSGQVSVTNPSGGLCLAPSTSNGTFIADSDTSNFASVTALLAAPLLCTNGNYVFNTYLNLPQGTTSVAAGAHAGFKVRLSSLLSASLLGDNIFIRTYLDGTLQETASGGGTVAGIDVLALTGTSNLYFTTTKAFNRVELVIGTAIIPVGVAFETDVFYGYAAQGILPVTLTNVKATAGNGSVTVSWQSLNETNLNHYEVERSKDGRQYLPAGSVKSKGQGSSILYTFTDNISVEGGMLYRVKAVNNDGSFITSPSVSVSVSSGSAAKIYPSPALAGQTVQVTVPQTGTYRLLLFDAQGRLAKQQQVVAASSTVYMPTAGLAHGVYQIKLISGNGAVKEARLIIQ